MLPCTQRSLSLRQPGSHAPFRQIAPAAQCSSITQPTQYPVASHFGAEGLVQSCSVAQVLPATLQAQPVRRLSATTTASEAKESDEAERPAPPSAAVPAELGHGF